jgi:hypothetical protein
MRVVVGHRPRDQVPDFTPHRRRYAHRDGGQDGPDRRRVDLGLRHWPGNDARTLGGL